MLHLRVARALASSASLGPEHVRPQLWRASLPAVRHDTSTDSTSAHSHVGGRGIEHALARGGRWGVGLSLWSSAWGEHGK